jgi:hypothetical protein
MPAYRPDSESNDPPRHTPIEAAMLDLLERIIAVEKVTSRARKAATLDMQWFRSVRKPKPLVFKTRRVVPSAGL